jgi:hypothetical protein
VLEGDLIQSVTVVLPGLSESDMAKADRAPGKQSSQTGQSLKPNEDGVSITTDTDVSKSTDGDDGDNSRKRTTRLINEREESGSIALLRESNKSSATAVDARDTDRQDRNKDDDVHERIVSLEMSVGGSDDEGRGTRLVVAGVQKSGILRVDEETDEEKANHVEESDSPEDLLDGAGESLGGVLGFGSSETDKFCSTEGEGCSDEHT